MEKKAKNASNLRESVLEESRASIECFMLKGKTLGDFIKSLPSGKTTKQKHGKYMTEINYDKSLFDYESPRKTTNITNDFYPSSLKKLYQTDLLGQLPMENVEENNESYRSIEENMNDDNNDDHNEDNDNDNNEDNDMILQPDFENASETNNETQEIRVSTFQDFANNPLTIESNIDSPIYVNNIIKLEDNFSSINRQIIAEEQIIKMKPPKPHITINSFQIINNITKQDLFTHIKSSTKMKIGAICCFQDELFIGQENGYIHKYSLKDNRELFIFKPKESITNAVLWSLDTNMGKYIIGGFSNGDVHVIHNIKMKTLCVLKKISRHGIISIKMTLTKRQRMTFLACDHNGMIYKIKLKTHRVFSNESLNEVVYDNNIPIYHMTYFKHEKEQLIALSTLEAFKVIKIKPDKGEILSIPRHDKNKEKFLYDFCFGHGFIKKLINDLIEQNKESVLCLSTGALLSLYSIEMLQNDNTNNSTSHITGFKLIHELDCNTSIMKIGFLTESIIYFIDEFYQMKLISTIDFNSVFIITMPSLYNIVDLSQLSILSLNIFVDFKTRINKETYDNFIISSDNSINILGANNFNMISLRSSEECIMDMISKGDQWNYIFELASDLFNDRHILWTQSNTNNEIINTIISEYLTFILKPNELTNENKDNESKQYLLLQCFEFCLDIGHFDLILNNIYLFLIGRNKDELFFKTLEPYIQLGFLKNKSHLLPNDFIKNMIYVYINQKQFLTQLIYHMDLHCFETTDIFNLLQQNNNISAIIYIVTNSHSKTSLASYNTSNNEGIDNYFIPLAMMSDLLTNINGITECYIPSLLNPLDQIDYYDEDLFNSSQYITLKIFWYCSIILDSSLHIHWKKIKEDKLNYFIIHIALWLISDSIFQALIRFEPFAYFSVWEKIMNNETYLNVIKNQGLAEFRYILKELKLCHIKQFLPMNFIGILQKKVGEINQRKIYKAFYDFISYISYKKTIKFGNELLINAARFLLSYEGENTYNIINEDTNLIPSNSRIMQMLKEVSQFSHEDIISLLNCFNNDDNTLKDNYSHFDLIKDYLLSLME